MEVGWYLLGEKFEDYGKNFTVMDDGNCHGEEKPPTTSASVLTHEPGTSERLSESEMTQQATKPAVLKTFVSLKKTPLDGESAASPEPSSSPPPSSSAEIMSPERKYSASTGRTLLKTTVKISPDRDDDGSGGDIGGAIYGRDCNEEFERATPVDAAEYDEFEEDTGVLSDVSDPVGAAIDNAARMRRLMSTESRGHSTMGEDEDEARALKVNGSFNSSSRSCSGSCSSSEDFGNDVGNQKQRISQHRLPPVGCSDDALSNSSGGGGLGAHTRSFCAHHIHKVLLLS